MAGTIDPTKKPVAVAKNAVKAANLIVQGIEDLYQLYTQTNNGSFDTNELDNAVVSDMVGIEHVSSSSLLNCLTSANTLIVFSDYLKITKVAK